MKEEKELNYTRKEKQSGFTTPFLFSLSIYSNSEHLWISSSLSLSLSNPVRLLLHHGSFISAKPTSPDSGVLFGSFWIENRYKQKLFVGFVVKEGI